jgi:hypothetical protein
VGAPAPVLGPRGSTSIDAQFGLKTLADEHSTIVPPGTLKRERRDYLFFVPTESSQNTRDSGLVVLSSPGPTARGQWRLQPAKGFGPGQIFISPVQRKQCPQASDAESSDHTFDLNYANPGSVLINPTRRGPDEVFMLYEATNRCTGVSKPGKLPKNSMVHFYATLGVANSTDFGHDWPVYRKDFTALPHQRPYGAKGIVGPNIDGGAFGKKDLCIANSCSASVPSTFGRYPVVSPPYTLDQAIDAAWKGSSGTPLPFTVGNQTPSAFVDRFHTAGGTYVYSVQGYDCNPSDIPQCAYPGSEDGAITISRARLHGSANLRFENWYGKSVSFASGTRSASFTAGGLGDGFSDLPGHPGDRSGMQSPLFPKDTSPADLASFASCQAATQTQGYGSISYVYPSNQYLLVFVCDSPGDPQALAAGKPGGSRGTALFYSTLDGNLYTLADGWAWSTPGEIGGSWHVSTPNKANQDNVNIDWYPSLMSLGADKSTPPGQLNFGGYIFSMSGSPSGPTPNPRSYMVQPFKINFTGSQPQPKPPCHQGCV